MNIAFAINDLGHEALPNAGEAGPAPKRIVVAYGFWIFLLSALRRLRGACARDCGWSDQCAAVQSNQRRHRDRLSTRLELHLWADVAGASPQRSAFLSAFFTLVGCHGLHVATGLIWLAVMMAQVTARGFRASVERRLLCFALFWHALDIVWVWLFTVVYLMGVRP